MNKNFTLLVIGLFFFGQSIGNYNNSGPYVGIFSTIGILVGSILISYALAYKKK